MSLKHKQVDRATKLARRSNVRQGTSVVFVPKGVKLVHGKVIHPNPNVCGPKERERGARCYMQPSFRHYGPWPDPLNQRSAPVVQITSKRRYYEIWLGA